jgi:MFS family permease
MQRYQLKIITLSSLGAGLELYDFLVFVVFASGISHAFFPSSAKLVRLLSVFSIFAVGYLIRPLGGLILGFLGDKYGRKKYFTFSISLMAFATLTMAMLPTYSQIGVASPILFFILRLLQGFSIGGELPGAITFVSEHGGQRIGLACGILFFFLNSGLLLANGFYALLTHILTKETLMFYGWRFAFLLGGSLAGISYLMRRYLYETQAFRSLSKSENNPILTLLKNHQLPLLKGLVTTCLGACLMSVFLIYLAPFMTEILQFKTAKAGRYALYQTLLFTFISPLMSVASDKISRTHLLMLGSLLLLVTPLLLMKALYQQNWILLTLTLNTVAMSLISGIFPSFLVEIFPVNVRFCAIALCYNVPFSLIGGIAPMLTTFLSIKYGLTFAPAYLAQSFALILVITLVLSKLLALKNEHYYLQSHS